jgi:hypothetical protein
MTRLENAILQVQARFVKQRVSRGVTSAGTCKTFYNPEIHMFKTVVVLSVIPNPSFDCTAWDKGLPDIKFHTLKTVQKFHMTLTFCAANLKSLI